MSAERVIVLVRALSGGEVEDREIVRVVRALVASQIPAASLADALVAALERAERHHDDARGISRSLGLAGAAVFGGSGAALGLHALGAALPSFSRLFALVPLVGVAAVVAAVARGERTRADRQALALSVMHELAAVGVPLEAARDAAVYAAGEGADRLSQRLESEPLPAGLAIERPRAAAAVLVARLLDDRPIVRARAGTRRWAVGGALWIALGFWALWLLGVGRGFAEVAW